jgi:putative transposase
MSIPSRNNSNPQIKAGTRTFFVTSSTSQKMRLLQSERMARLFVDVLFSYRAAGRFKVHAFVVMPDHIHVLLSVDSSTTIEAAMQFIKGGFSSRVRKELGIRLPIWQRGFSETRVLDEVSYSEHIRYTHENPGRAHLPTNAVAYEYCSTTGAFQLDPKPQGLKPNCKRSLGGTTEVVP